MRVLLSKMKRVLVAVCMLICLSLLQNVVVAEELDVECSCECVFEKSPEAILDSIIPRLYSELPQYVNLSDDDYFPPIGNQSSLGACTAWATVYYQFTYEAAKYMSEKDENNEGSDEWKPKTDSSKRFSPTYVWCYLNQGENKGVFYKECCDFLKEMGSIKQHQASSDIIWSTWQYCNTETLMEALQIRVSDFYIYKFSDSSSVPVITKTDDEQLYNMKLLLSQGHPLVIHTNYSGFDIRNLENGEYVCIRVEGQYSDHSMTVVGYDDNIQYDLNGINGIEDFEKGAFLVANSHGTEVDEENDGFIWVMYDALNEVSSVSDNSFNENRIPAFNCYEYGTLEVYEPSNDVMVEVCIGQTIRNDFSIELGASSSSNGTAIIEKTIFDKFGGPYDFYGRGLTDIYYRYFTFDYDKLYDGVNDNFFIRISDISPNNGANTIIKSIRWLDAEGNVLKEINEQDTLSGESKSYAYSRSNTEEILLIDDEFDVYYNDYRSVHSVIALSGIEKADLLYTSSNPSVIGVDSSGNLIYNSKGTAVITISTIDGSVSKNITFNYYDDYRDSFDNPYVICPDDSLQGVIDRAYDLDNFEFTVKESGNYVFYTEGTTDTILKVFNSNGDIIASNDDYASDKYYNAGVGYYFEKGDIYYIQVSAYSSEDGSYNLNMKYADEGDIITNYVNTGNQHHFSLEGRVLSIFDSITIEYGMYTQDIAITENLDAIYYEDDEFYCTIEFEQISGSEYINWIVNVYISNDFLFNTQNIVFTFNKDDLSINYRVEDGESI